MFIADIHVKKLLEGGETNIKCRSLFAKMVNGKNITINSLDRIGIEAMYVQNANIHAKSMIEIGLLKGSAEIDSKESDAIISSIDGSFNITAKGRVDLQINKLLSGTISTAQSSTKSITTRIDPQV